VHRAFVDDAESEYTLARDWNSSSQTTFTKELVGKLLSGGVAGAVSRTATAPIDRVKTILQSGRLPEGLTGRSGTAASASADSTNSSSVTHKGTGTSTGKGTGTSTSRTVAAAVRGSKSNSHGYSKGPPPHVSPPTMRAAVRAIYREGGGFAFWRGNGANILKVVPETGVKFATFDALKHLIAVDPGNATTSERFVAGGIAGATAQLVIYPLEIVKTRMALSGGGVVLPWGRPTVVLRREIVVRVEAAAAVGLGAVAVRSNHPHASQSPVPYAPCSTNPAPKVCSGV
tara:strand:- start:11455 stop:12315 length:861 start_codon:yes stop_codon:yes gene_type:complete